MGVNFDVAGVDHQPLVIWVFDEQFEQCLPLTSVAPTTEPAVSVFPVTVVGWQIAPGCAGAQNPEDGIDKSPIITGYAAPSASATR